MGLRERVNDFLDSLKEKEPEEEKLETSKPTLIIEVEENDGAYLSFAGFNSHTDVVDVLLGALSHQIVEAAKEGDLSLELIKNLCINQIKLIQEQEEDKEDEIDNTFFANDIDSVYREKLML